MKIGSTTGYNYSPNFGAKLAPQTLKALTKEIEATPQGNKILANCLETVKRLGHKDTVIAIGNAYKHGEYCYVGYEFPDEWIEYTVRDITITNPILGEEYSKFTQSYANTLEKTIKSLTNKEFASHESAIFGKHLQKNENVLPMTIFKEILPFLKGSKNTLEEVFNVTKTYNKEFLKDKGKELDDIKATLASKEEIFKTQEKESEATIKEMNEILSKDNIMNEREQILEMYS